MAAASRAKPRDYFGGEIPSRRNQITIPTTGRIVRKVDEMIAWVNESGREWQNKRFDKTRFYNSLLLGIIQVFDDPQIDHDEIEEKGLFAYLIDNGAYLLSQGHVAESAERVGLNPWSTAESLEEKEDRPPVVQKKPTLRIPDNFLLDRKEGDGTGGAKGK